MYLRLFVHLGVTWAVRVSFGSAVVVTTCNRVNAMTGISHFTKYM